METSCRDVVQPIRTPCSDRPVLGRPGYDRDVWDNPAMDPLIHPSARRHGVSDSGMLHAYRNPFKAVPEGVMTMLVGDDGSGRVLEVGVERTDDGDLIIHAMPARRKYL